MAFTQVLALAPMMKTKRVKEYIRELPEITQDLCKMFYRCSSHSILEVRARDSITYSIWTTTWCSFSSSGGGSEVDVGHAEHGGGVGGGV